VTIRNEGYELVPIDRVKPHPRNAKKGNVQFIRESIDRNGFYGALVVQRKTSFILVGNHRWKAAKQAGMTEIPVLWVDVDETTERRLLLVDNRSSEIGSYDEEGIVALLKGVQDATGSLEGTGYNASDLDKFLEDLTPNDADEADAAPKLDGLKYQVVVDCEGEEHQGELLTRFEGEGLRCRPLIL
jgi:ParB-like chromosome segregation protein Spo0J